MFHWYNTHNCNQPHPFEAYLEPLPSTLQFNSLSEGKYVLGHAGHFTSLRVYSRDDMRLYQSHRTDDFVQAGLCCID
jgi:hypothetical protein